MLNLLMVKIKKKYSRSTPSAFFFLFESPEWDDVRLQVLIDVMKQEKTKKSQKCHEMSLLQLQAVLDKK